MILNSILIKNFRSIKDLKIGMTPNCQIFVGVNETGKSNILNAISHIDLEKKFAPMDLRMATDINDKVDEAFIRYIFSFSREDHLAVHTSLKNLIYNLDNISIIISQGNIDMNLYKYICSIKSALLVADVKNNKKYFSTYKRVEDTKLADTWLIVKQNTDKNTEISLAGGEKIIIADYSIFQSSAINEESKDFFEVLDIDGLNKIINESITKYMQTNQPHLIFWEYRKDNLLPETINLNEFISDTSICKPLESMFWLAGIENIKETIEDSQKRGRYYYNHLLNNVSKANTDYFREIWSDYRGVGFELKANGENLDIGIMDAKNVFPLEQRSDGFKRFITFLLLLSAKVKNNEIINSVIIIDEPDIGLHISGQRHLLKELIRISETNNVFFTTHSIFMIDKEKPDRHYIVKRTNEETQIRNVAESDWTDEEVTYRALGYSMFEALNENNIIFEGWTDKKIYNKATAKLGLSDQSKEIKHYSVIHAKGVTTIVNIAKMIELAGRNYFVVSDSDRMAKQHHIKYLEEQCVGKWIKYGDIVSGIITVEDFLENKYLVKSLDAITDKNPDWTKVDKNILDNTEFNKLDVIRNWIKANVAGDNELLNNMLILFKETLIENLEAKDIRSEYVEFLNGMATQVLED